MSQLKVQSAKLKKEFETQNGTLYSFMVIGELDGELDTVDMNFKKPENAPKTGEVLEVTVEETQWGKKAKKVQQNTFKGYGGAPRQEDPERQASIIRQSSFKAAALMRSKEADILIAEKKYDEAHEAIKLSTVMDLSNFIVKYVEGKITKATDVPARGIIDVLNEDPLGHDFDDAEQYMGGE